MPTINVIAITRAVIAKAHGDEPETHFAICQTECPFAPSTNFDLSYHQFSASDTMAFAPELAFPRG